MKATIAFCFAALVLMGACTTSKDVRAGDAWEDERPADYKATKEQVVEQVDKWLKGHDYTVQYNDDKSYVKAYRKGDSIVEQNIELHVKIEPGPTEDTTTVTTAGGRSLGIEVRGNNPADRLQKALRAKFG